MKTTLVTAATLLVLSGAAAHAAGDVAQGEQDFKKCKACHSILAPDGEVIVKGGISGPNLWGVVGRQAGTEADFGRYSPQTVALGEAGLVWTPEDMAAYVPNAKEFLMQRTGESSVKTAMTPQTLDDVTDVIAYLSQFGTE